MPDLVFNGFLERQREDGLALSDASDLLDLEPEPADPPARYLARLRCKGLVRSRAGEIETASFFLVGITFPSDYLRRAEPVEVLAWLGPRNVFHPNISGMPPMICAGPIAPGTSLVDLLHRVFEIVTYQRVTMREDDALNHAACVWAKQHQDRFPVDARPLRRRRTDLTTTPTFTEATT